MKMDSHFRFKCGKEQNKGSPEIVDNLSKQASTIPKAHSLLQQTDRQTDRQTGWKQLAWCTYTYFSITSPDRLNGEICLNSEKEYGTDMCMDNIFRNIIIIVAHACLLADI